MNVKIDRYATFIRQPFRKMKENELKYHILTINDFVSDMELEKNSEYKKAFDDYVDALTDSIANLQVPADLTGDLSSQKSKDSQLNSSKQNVVSQVAAMNAATAQMVIMQVSLFQVKEFIN